MPEQKKKYLKNFLFLFTGNSVSQVIPFLLAPVIGRLYSPEQLSVQENFLAIVSLISIVAAGRYEIAFVLPAVQKKANNLFVLAWILTFSISLLSLLSLFFRNEIIRMYRDEALGEYIYYIAPAVFLASANNLLAQWIIRPGKYSLLSASRISQTFIQNSGYALLGFWGWGVNGLIVAWMAGNIISALLLLVPSVTCFSKKDVSPAEMKAAAVEYRDFPVINSIHAFTDIFATQFLLFWLITRHYGPAALGLFAVMNRYLRAPLGMIGSAVSQLYYREASVLKNEHQSLTPIFNRSVLLIAAVAVPSMVIVFFFGPGLFALYLGEKWRLAGEYARIMAPAIAFNFILSSVSSTPLLFDRQKRSYVYSSLVHLTSLGTLFIAVQYGAGFHTVLLAFSLSLSASYIALFLWYRMLINSKQ